MDYPEYRVPLIRPLGMNMAYQVGIETPISGDDLARIKAVTDA